MNRRRLLATSGFLAAAALAGCLAAPRQDRPSTNNEPKSAIPDLTSVPTINDEELAALVHGNAEFALDLHKSVTEDEVGNLFTSPYSISMALAMVYAGAQGQTASEMEEVLRFTLGDELHPSFHSLQTELLDRATTLDDLGKDPDDAEEVDAFRLEIANALWAGDAVDWDDDYVDLLDAHYGAGLRYADFSGDPSGERDRINAWVADVTEDRIDELLPSGSVTPNTTAVLTNAIYFLASWLHEFDPEDTEVGTFTNEDGSTAEVPFMHQSIRTNYAELDVAEAIELPYVGEEVSMVLIRPKGELAAFEEQLDAETLFGIFDALGDAAGELAMPKFEIDSELQLSEVLQDLGMPTAFGGGADFSGMVEGDGSGMMISEVFHEGTITVDEQGTEAAAATAVLMVSSAPPNWGELRLDRPFLLCIRDRPTDAVLFLGRVAEL